MDKKREGQKKGGPNRRRTKGSEKGQNKGKEKEHKERIRQKEKEKKEKKKGKKKKGKGKIMRRKKGRIKGERLLWGSSETGRKSDFFLRNRNEIKTKQHIVSTRQKEKTIIKKKQKKTKKRKKKKQKKKKR